MTTHASQIMATRSYSIMLLKAEGFYALVAMLASEAVKLGKRPSVLGQWMDAGEVLLSGKGLPDENICQEAVHGFLQRYGAGAV